MNRPERASPSGLADLLIAKGELPERSRLTDAFRTVDRGAFVPEFALYEHQRTGPAYRLVRGDVPEQRAEWERHVYADESLIIEIDGLPVGAALPGGTGTGRWTSSSTMPGLMARMLRELHLDTDPPATGTSGVRVLEVGTGSGYNAALLAECLGSDLVASVDISARLVSDAAGRLAAQGYGPALAATDGHRGFPAAAPYDRVIGTTAFTHVPYSWVEQTAPGGLLLVNIAGGTGGAMAVLRVGGDGTAEGRFLEEWAGFMPARHDVAPRRVSVDDTGAGSLTSVAPALRWDPAFAFLAQLATVDADTVLARSDAGAELLFMEGADGAWAEIETVPVDGRYPVTQGGPRRLWTAVEDAYAWWGRHREPDWSSFGITVTPDAQHVWHRSDAGRRQWRLPTGPQGVPPAQNR